MFFWILSKLPLPLHPLSHQYGQLSYSMQERECNSQNYERNALLTFMNPCLIITAVTAGHWLGVGKICTTPAYESFVWMLFGLL